jgi:hypothetical protein
MRNNPAFASVSVGIITPTFIENENRRKMTVDYNIKIDIAKTMR